MMSGFEDALVDIVMVSSEAVPFAKTGGLADVCGTLPLKLAAMGHRCSIFLPAYQRVFQTGIEIHDTHIGFVISTGGRQVACRVLKGTLGSSPVDFYFIDQPHYFDRAGLYGDSHGDYRDNCERFCFFNRAVVQAIETLRLPVDIIHCHDWQSGLVPAYVKTNFENLAWYQRAASVMTIHNLAYQGRFWQHDMALTGLDWSRFNMHELEFYGDLCLLKSGVVYSDAITTVSPTYAREIQTPQFGCGMDAVLRSRSESLTGIVNGVDYLVWDPFRDTCLPQTYSVENWKEGKQAAKSNLRQELGLPQIDGQPLIGIIGRLADQKGWDLIIPLLRRWLHDHEAQWVILGSGENRYQDALSELAHHAPHRLALRLEFSEPLSHRIEAASDMFLMPSRYEPCGLNQLYSLKYGSVPIVHATGGLVDTVVDTHSATLENRTATGFSFHEYSVDALHHGLMRAYDLFLREPARWSQIVETGMNQDWSWGESAKQYVGVYQRVLHERFGRNG